MKNVLEFVGMAFVHVIVGVVRAAFMAVYAAAHTFVSELVGDVQSSMGASARPTKYRHRPAKASR